MLQPVRQAVVDSLIRDMMVVIKKENDSSALGRDLVEQGRQDRLDERSTASPQALQRALAQIGLDGLEGGDDIVPELGWVVVLLIERKPSTAGAWRLDLRP
jgi:hypothetical protein